jgi:hypothetical protein
MLFLSYWSARRWTGRRKIHEPRLRLIVFAIAVTFLPVAVLHVMLRNAAIRGASPTLWRYDQCRRPARAARHQHGQCGEFRLTRLRHAGRGVHPARRSDQRQRPAARRSRRANRRSAGHLRRPHHSTTQRRRGADLPLGGAAGAAVRRIYRPARHDDSRRRLPGRRHYGVGPDAAVSRRGRSRLATTGAVGVAGRLRRRRCHALRSVQFFAHGPWVAMLPVLREQSYTAASAGAPRC